MIKFIQNRKLQLNLSWICFVIAAYGLYLRMMERMKNPLSGDELVQFQALQNVAFTFWRRVAFYGDHTSFPGELILNYPFVKLWGMNKWLVSIPHMVLNIIGFFFLYKICQRFLQTKFAVILVFLIYSINFNLVYHSSEFRPYAVLHVFAILSLYLADIIVNQFDNISRGQKIRAAFLLIFIFIYHAYGIVIVLLPLAYVFGLAFLQNQGLRSYPGKLYLSIVLGIAIAIWCWYASYNLFRFGLPPIHAGQGHVQVFEFIPDPRKNILGFLKGVIGNLFGGRIFYPLLSLVILAFLLPCDVKKYLSLVCFFVFLVVLPVTAVLVSDLKTQYWFLQRQFTWVIPFWALFIGRCWDKIILREGYKIL